MFFYFPTKEELFQAAIMTPLQEARDHLTAIFDAPFLRPVEKLMKLVTEQITGFVRFNTTFRKLLHQILQYPDQFPNGVSQIYSFTDWTVSMLSTLIEAAQKADELTAVGNPEHIALSYLAYINGLGVISRDDWSEESRQYEKGDVLYVAELAGIMAAKRTPELIPLSHSFCPSRPFPSPVTGRHRRDQRIASPRYARTKPRWKFAPL
ncbi:MAG: hypothetical protein K6T81_17540 [Alicyclobacillus macrosporangiidus]|nr:hypothetical protein [Alicyclobacillus macrosporangiidus]